MKFSIIYEAQMVDTSRENEARNFHEMIEQSILAEQLGFDCIWAVEHTSLTQYAHMSAPETFLAYLAAKTTRIHVGHGVVCLPFNMNHPIKVAERIATLDILSRGRLEFGVGKGGTPQEAGAFGNKLEDLQPQIDESMYMIPKMWLDGDFEHKSDLITIPPRPIWPKPYQTPHPKMYLACTRAETLVTAGSRGMGALVLGMSGPDEIARKNEIYRKCFAERDPADQVGFRPNEHFAALCPAVILADGEKARRMGLRGQKFFADSLTYWYAGGPKPDVADLIATEQSKEIDKSREQFTEMLIEKHLPINIDTLGNYHIEDDAYGNVDSAIRYVERLKAAGADEILFLLQMGTIPHEAIIETITNIGNHLIPHFNSGQQSTRSH
jgi:alkanesulfonate monooxygenase SsuD/methylene tetrahydromethanopterin reductase-like flavin-dependent oxidoreductase (luciferase family)